jgi:hypothetical protein
MRYLAGILFMALALGCRADTNVVASTNKTASTRGVEKSASSQQAQNALAQRAEEIRMSCIEGRRYVSGRVMQILPEGLVVDSGYAELLKPPFNQSWVVRANVAVTKNPSLIEEKKADAICVGLVFLTNIPKKPAVKPYDYVVIHGYPAGEHLYAPVPSVEKTIRQFSASLERAVSLTLAASEK